jgi:hypothetical protein
MTTSDLYQYGISLLDQYELLIAFFLAALVVVMFLGRRNIKQAWQNAQMRYRLNRLGLKEISNFTFPDGLGNYFNIDRMIMRHDGISLLQVKQYPGSIFCADDINEWTQMLAGKSYRFKNPLIELDYQVKAVSACIPGVPVDGFLYFDTQAEFPKGHPDRVIRSDSIPEALKRNKNLKAQASVESAWEKLGALKVTG